jgi:hypothetical protein
MLIRISLILAIIAGLAVAALNFTKIKETITTTRAERDEWHGKFDKTDADLRKTTKDLSATKAELAETKQNLEGAVAAKAKAEAEAADKVKLALQLQENIKDLQAKLSSAQSDLAAYKASGLTPEQCLAAAKTIKGLEQHIAALDGENRTLLRELDKAKVELAKYRIKDYHVPLPADLAGKVVVSDPKWDFVIINVGEDQDVRQDGELLVNRGGQLIAKLKITAVEKDRSIANVMPGWKLGEVMEGDQVFPAYPKQ